MAEQYTDVASVNSSMDVLFRVYMYYILQNMSKRNYDNMGLINQATAFLHFRIIFLFLYLANRQADREYSKREYARLMCLCVHNQTKIILYM